MIKQLFIAFISLLLTNNISAQDITSGLVLNYTFSQATDKTITDESDNTYNATLKGNASISAKDNKSTLSLDGLADNYLEIEATNSPGSLLGGLSEFTISTWVYINAHATWARIFDFGSGTENYMFAAPNGGSGMVRYAIKYNGTEQWVDGSQALPVGDWVHFAISYSGTTAKIYVNATLDGEKTISYSPATLGANNFTQNYLGKSQWPDPYLNGHISDFRIYNRALTASDIDELVFSISQLKSDLQSAITIADGFQNPTNDLSTAIASAKVTLAEAATATAIKQAVEDLNTAIMQFKFDVASIDNPYDITYQIVNPSFESAFEGWTNSGMATQNNTVFPRKAGNTYIEKWVSRGSNIPDVSVQQEVNGLPNGFYSLIVAAGNIQQTGAGSTINNSTKAQTGAYIFAGTNTAAVDTIKDRTIDFFVTNETVTIGIKTENATGNWLTCDNFRLLYKGFGIEQTKLYVQELIDSAKVLLLGKINNAVRTELDDAINSGDQAIADQAVTAEALASVIQNLINATGSAQLSANSYIALQNGINSAVVIYADGNGNEGTALNSAIDTATNRSNNFNINLSDVNAATQALETAVFKYNLANATGVVPKVITNQNYARGATMAFGRSTITGVTVSSLREHGFCWSTHPEPTVLDNRTTSYLTNNGYIYQIKNLKPSTVYYMRAYALTTGSAVGYGEVVKVITLPKGIVTYNLTSGLTGDNRVRMEAAMSSAVGYYNNLTSIKGLHLTVNYGSGTPTAEASYGGWMRFGPNASYQKTGTALHEMGHAIGVGQHSMWYGPSSPLRETGSRGLWLGKRVDKVVQFIENDPNAHLTGDNVHMWPYGINGAQEDNGSELLYITNSLITQALGEDGLPPTGGFATPAYTFNTNDGSTYYIKSEEKQTGRDDAFITLDKSGNLVNKTMTPTEALNNDSAAWKIEFNPTNSYYTIKNVATGRYFTFRNSGNNGIHTITRQTPVTADYFQIMGARIETTVVSGSKSITSRGYWIIHPEAKASPACLQATTNTMTITGGFNIANSSTRQRWLLLDVDDVNKISSSVTSIDEINANSSSNIRVYSKNKQIVVANIKSEIALDIYNTSGILLISANKISSSFSQTMPAGIYMVVLKSDAKHEVRKVVVN